MRIIGVTDFLPAEETPQAAAAAAPSSAPPAARQPGPDDACPPLTPIRLEEMAT
jgi:hypothetical protein